MISNNDLFCVLLKTRLLLYFYISVVCGGLFKKVKLVNKYTVTESVWIDWSETPTENQACRFSAAFVV